MNQVVTLSKDELYEMLENVARQTVAEAIRKFPKTGQPRPVCVTQKQAAEMLGLCETTVSRRVRDGSIRLNSVGMIPITEIDRLAGFD